MPLDLELLTTGPNAHGYGRLDDGRTFAFRVRNRKARLEVYRMDADGVEPAPADVELVGELSSGTVNLDSTRSLTVLLGTLAAVATPGQVRPERTLRAYLGTVDAVMADWANAAAAHLAAAGPDAA